MSEGLPAFKLSRGKGMHPSLFAYSCRMAEHGVDPELVEEYLKSSSEVVHYHRDVPDREIEAAVEDAYNVTLNLTTRERIPPLSGYDAAKAREIYDDYECDLADLESISPQAPPSTVREALTKLYDQNDYICLARDLKRARTKLLSKWLEFDDDRLATYQFIVPNPMSAEYGFRKNGTGMSPRTYNNTGERKFIVCDFDFPAKHIQPSLIVHLAEYCGAMPVLVLSSGNKSIHAWWRCDGLDQDEIRTFENEAASVGADPAILGDARKNQLVRMPMGIRSNNEKQQQVHFWNHKQY